MSFEESLKAKKGATKRPYLAIIYGAGGCGKTGLCLSAPDPFFLAVEPGCDWVDAQKFADDNGNPIIAQTSDQLFAMIRWLCSNDNRASLDYPVKTVIIDSLGFAQRLFYADIVAKNPVTKGRDPKPVESIIDLGYDGMGYAMDYWERLLAGCNALRKRGLNVILITHAEYKNVDTEGGERTKRIDFALQVYGNYNVPELLKRSADAVYYMNSEIETVTRGKGDRTKTLIKGNSEAQTVISTRSTGLYYAKSRAQNEEQIPDKYYFDLSNRAEISAQIFHDLDKA